MGITEKKQSLSCKKKEKKSLKTEIIQLSTQLLSNKRLNNQWKIRISIEIRKAANLSIHNRMQSPVSILYHKQ